MPRKFVIACMVIALFLIAYCVWMILESMGINKMSVFLSVMLFAAFISLMLGPFLKEAEKIRKKNRWYSQPPVNNTVTEKISAADMTYMREWQKIPCAHEESIRES